MSLKRNLTIYIKEKSTITAFVFFILFIIFTSLTFVDSLWYKKGIHDEFEKYNVTYMNSSNNSVIYAASNNVMFYSQNKEHESTLNNFTGVEAYTNAYVGANYKPYNFVRINYTFPSNIKEIKGTPDNLIGEGGETYILTQDGGLYSISSRSKTVENLFSNVKKFEVKYDSTLNRNTILVLDENNLLSLYYFDFQILVKRELYQGNIDEFYLCDKDKIIIRMGKDLFNIYLNEVEEYEYIDKYPYDFKIYKDNYYLEHIKLQSTKLLNYGDCYYSLYNNEISYFEYDKENKEFIKFDNDKFFKTYNFSKKVNDIYITGYKLLIVNIEDGIYQSEENESFDNISFVKFEYDTDNIYINRNTKIFLDEKGRLNLYNKKTNSFEVMYQRALLKNIIRYFSMFVTVMTLFYLIMSFTESNKRYNRYFKVNKTI